METIKQNFRITDATMTAEDKAVSLNVTYLLTGCRQLVCCHLQNLSERNS